MLLQKDAETAVVLQPNMNFRLFGPKIEFSSINFVSKGLRRPNASRKSSNAQRAIVVPSRTDLNVTQSSSFSLKSHSKGAFDALCLFRKKTSGEEG
jgi:hypothetical protein